MTQEDINELMEKNMPQWLKDQRAYEYDGCRDMALERKLTSVLQAGSELAETAQRLVDTYENGQHEYLAVAILQLDVSIAKWNKVIAGEKQ